MDGPIGPLEQSIALDRSGALPLFVQIAAGLERLVAGGTLGSGSRLPAERELASALGVNRATVGRAYRELEARGLVASRVGSGTVVARAGAAPGAARGAAAPADDRASFSRGIRELARAVEAQSPPGPEGAIDFALMHPDVELFPRPRLREAVQAALARGPEVLQYGAPAGLLSLREAIARRLVRSGIPAGPEEVVVVNGIQQALDLLAKTLLDPGDAVVVEAPTYANVLPLLRLYGAQTVAVPLDDEGMDVAALERALDARRPKLVYTIPSFHNPTGATLSRARRAALLAACRRRGVLVVEDAHEEELRWEGEPLPALAALDAGDGVAYLGSFSKGLFPGLRTGFVVARGELLRLLVLAKRFSDVHADLLSQAVLSEILVRGEYDRHLERLRRTYRGRMERTLQAMAASFPAGVRWGRPQGGYSTWVELPPGVRASAIAEEARRLGVLVLAGRPFFAGGLEGERGLRLSISRTDPQRIEEGIAILGRVLAEALARDGRAEPHPEAPLV